MPVYTLDELISTPPKAIPSLVGVGLLPENGTMMVLGRTGIGKSIYAMDIAISMVLKDPLFQATWTRKDKTVVPLFPIRSQRTRVLYLDAELGVRSCYDRLKMMLRNHAADGISFGESFQIATGNMPIMSLGGNKKGLIQLDELIAQYKPTDDETKYVVFFDPITNYHTVDENSDIMKTVYQNLNNLKHKHNFAAIVVHHESDKDSFDSMGKRIKKTGTGRQRGSSVTSGFVDTMVAFSEIGRTVKGCTFMEIKWEKTRHQAQPPAGLIFVDYSRMRLVWLGQSDEIGPGDTKDFREKYLRDNPVDTDSLYGTVMEESEYNGVQVDSKKVPAVPERKKDYEM